MTTDTQSLPNYGGFITFLFVLLLFVAVCSLTVFTPVLGVDTGYFDMRGLVIMVAFYMLRPSAAFFAIVIASFLGAVVASVFSIALGALPLAYMDNMLSQPAAVIMPVIAAAVAYFIVKPDDYIKRSFAKMWVKYFLILLALYFVPIANMLMDIWDHGAVTSTEQLAVKEMLKGNRWSVVIFVFVKLVFGVFVIKFISSFKKQVKT